MTTIHWVWLTIPTTLPAWHVLGLNTEARGPRCFDVSPHEDKEFKNSGKDVSIGRETWIVWIVLLVVAPHMMWLKYHHEIQCEKNNQNGLFELAIATK